MRSFLVSEAQLWITAALLGIYSVVSATYCVDGREDEYREACVKLHSMLGRKPWQDAIPHTFNEDTPPDYIVAQGEWRMNDWKNARALCAKLDVLQLEGT